VRNNSLNWGINVNLTGDSTVTRMKLLHVIALVVLTIVNGAGSSCHAQHLPPPALGTTTDPVVNSPATDSEEAPASNEQAPPRGVEDFVVEKGVRVGPIALDATPADIQGILGAPGRVSPRGPGVVEQAWWTEELGEIRVVFVAERAAQILVTSPKFTTTEGVSPGDTLEAFAQKYTLSVSMLKSYAEHDQDGNLCPVFYCKTEEGLGIKLLPRKSDKPDIAALIVSGSGRDIFPQIGAIPLKAPTPPDAPEPQTKPQPKAANPKPVRLTRRQRATALSAIKDLEALKSYVTYGMDFSGYDRAFALTQTKVNAQLSRLPKNALSEEILKSLMFYQVALTMWHSDTSLSPLAQDNQYQRNAWDLLKHTWSYAFQSIDDAKKMIR